MPEALDFNFHQAHDATVARKPELIFQPACAFTRKRTPCSKRAESAFAKVQYYIVIRKYKLDDSRAY